MNAEQMMADIRRLVKDAPEPLPDMLFASPTAWPGIRQQLEAGGVLVFDAQFGDYTHANMFYVGGEKRVLTATDPDGTEYSSEYYTGTPLYLRAELSGDAIFGFRSPAWDWHFTPQIETEPFKLDRDFGLMALRHRGIVL